MIVGVYRHFPEYYGYFIYNSQFLLLDDAAEYPEINTGLRQDLFYISHAFFFSIVLCFNQNTNETHGRSFHLLSRENKKFERLLCNSELVFFLFNKLTILTLIIWSLTIPGYQLSFQISSNKFVDIIRLSSNDCTAYAFQLSLETPWKLPLPVKLFCRRHSGSASDDALGNQLWNVKHHKRSNMLYHKTLICNIIYISTKNGKMCIIT